MSQATGPRRTCLSYALRAAGCVVALLVCLAATSSCQKKLTGKSPSAHVAAVDADAGANADDEQSKLLPRVPPHNPNVWLYGYITGLAYGSSVTIVANQDTLPAFSRAGKVVLLADVPKGTRYDVAIPDNPRGQVCGISPKHGAVGPHTPLIQISCQLSVATANDVNDTVVIGQLDDASAYVQAPPDAASLVQPWGKVFTSVEGMMFVADRGNQRILGYYPAPLSGDSATVVLGQNDDFTDNQARFGRTGFDAPSAVGGGNGLLLVADTNNHRVVMYTPTPYGQSYPALVIGQNSFGSTSPGCGPAALNRPSQAATSGNTLLVTDTGNHRVLLWNTLPTVMGAAADVVLGQGDLTSCLPNEGTGSATALGLNSPQDTWADANHLVVADFGNQRVLIWAQLPVLSGQAADYVVGQADLNSSGYQTTSSTSLNGPMSVVFDDNTLFVADAQDHRVLAFNPFPSANGSSASYALGQHLSTDNACNQNGSVAPYTLCYPTGVSFVSGDLAVTDSNNHRVLIFYSDPNATPQGSFSVVVSAGSSFFAAHLTSFDATAGEIATATVTAIDYQGQTNTAYVGTVSFSSTDPNAILPTPYTYTLGDAGMHDFNVVFFRAANQSLGVYDTQNTGVRGVDPSVVVGAGDANYLVAAGFPSNPNVGQQANMQVTAYDAWNNVATGFSGIVTFSSSDPNAVLPAPYTFLPADQGNHLFTASLSTPGEQNITVNANGLTVHGATQQNILVSNTTYKLGGTIVGVVNANVTLTNTSNADTIYASNGNFSFDQNVFYNANYNVTFTAPAGLNCNITHANGVMPASAVTNINLICSIVYVFTPAMQGNYVFDANYVSINANVASLLPLHTIQADVNTTNFNAGTFSGVLWDSNNQYLRLTAPPVTSSYITYLPFEVTGPYDSNTIDPNLGSNNVGGLGNCFSGPVGQATSYNHFTGNNAFQLSGSALNANAYVFMEMISLQTQNLTINSNSSIAYWIYPTGYHASGYGTAVNGNNSMYTALDVLFTDGTDTRMVSTLKDANNVVFNPQAQGAGGHLVLDQWNYVKVGLGALAGKTVQGIDVGWQNPNTTLGFETYVDDIMLANTSTQVPVNRASLDASWAPQFTSLVGYWPFEGVGKVADSAAITGTVGTSLTAHNSNGAGFTYINGRVGQGVYLDGVDDYLTIPTSNFPNTASMSVAAWVQSVYTGYDCPALLSIGTSGSQGLEVGPYCGGLAGGMYFYDSNSESVNGPYVGSGTWNHLVFTLDGTSGSANFYVNGILSGSGSFTPSLSSYLGTTPMVGAGTVCCTSNLHGIVDDLAVWGSVLSANDVAVLYSRQSPAGTGTFTSRVMPSPFISQAALGMEWNTTLPFYKPMLGHGGNDSVASYPSLAAGGLSTGLLLYWNFDEASLGAVPGGGDFADGSGNGYAGYFANLGYNGQVPTLGRPGRFNTGVYLNTTVDLGIWETTSFYDPESFSLQAWFNTSSSGGLFQFSDTLGWVPDYRDRLLYVGSSGHLYFHKVTRTASVVNDGLWHHAVATMDTSGNTSLYVDGVLVSAAPNTGGVAYSGYWNVGYANLDTWADPGRDTYLGYLDEMAIWNRVLSPNEVLQLYRRGANRHKMQMRTCASATCADNPNWLGPDGTAYSYFSELNNAANGNYLATSPNLLLGNFAPALSINTNNAYVQYRSILESDDTQKACNYGGTASACSPELQSFGLYRMNYGIGQSVTLHAGTLSYATLSGVTALLGSAGCSQGVSYALSPDGSSWYWYNSGWVPSNSTTAQSNTLAQLTPSVIAAFVTAEGAGQAYFKAFLNSQGTSPCALASVTFSP